MAPTSRNHAIARVSQHSRAPSRISLLFVWMFLMTNPGAADASNLVDRNPFMTPQQESQKKAEPTPQPQRSPPPLSLRGIMKIGETWEFSIHHKKKNQSNWVKLKDENAAYYVSAYDQEQKTITLKMSGQTVRLSLQKPDLSPKRIQAQVQRERNSSREKKTENSSSPNSKKSKVPRRRRIIKIN